MNSVASSWTPPLIALTVFTPGTPNNLLALICVLVHAYFTSRWSLAFVTMVDILLVSAAWALVEVHDAHDNLLCIARHATTTSPDCQQKMALANFFTFETKEN
jgi:hypothetical protein